MEINELGAANSQSAQSGSSSSLAKLSEDLDSFLTILTTQLQNQDPLSPLDTHEFTNQLVLFAGVEQDIQQNRNLEDLISLQQNNVAIGAVSYIGKEVEASGQEASLQDGEAKFSYVLPEAAQAATLSILGPDGKPVFLTAAETSAGRHDFVWDGKDSLGNTLPDGAYKIQVSAANSDDQPIDVDYSIIGRVTGVQVDDGDATLTLGTVDVPLSKVTRIRDATEEPAES